MTLLLRIAERAINRPLLVHPDKVPLILGVLEGRIPVGDVSAWREAADARIDAMPEGAQIVMRGPRPEASRFVGESIDEDAATGRKSVMPYKRTKDGVAIITITGSLINRGAWIGTSSGETSYEGIKHQVATAVADPRARAILLDIESPGGEAVGAFETAAAVRAANEQKPVIAVVNGMAASAAYALASGARRIVTGPTGLAGSIGVVMLHADYSRFLDKKGITPTLIFAGAHKVDGHPFGPLPEGVREDLQREVDAFYDLFIQTVATGRKNLSSSAIRATEARTFIGAAAVEAGLADAVGTFEEVLADLSRGLGRLTPSPTKGATMTTNAGAPAAETAGIPKTDHDAAVAKANADGKAEGKAEGLAEGRKAVADRFAAILADDKVKGRERTTLDLALKSPDMKAEDVIAFVAGLPVASTTPSIAQRAAAAGGDVGAGDGKPENTASAWDSAIAKVNASFGVPARK